MIEPRSAERLLPTGGNEQRGDNGTEITVVCEALSIIPSMNHSCPNLAKTDHTGKCYWPHRPDQRGTQEGALEEC